jgi:hypothetical protein
LPLFLLILLCDYFSITAILVGTATIVAPEDGFNCDGEGFGPSNKKAKLYYQSIQEEGKIALSPLGTRVLLWIAAGDGDGGPAWSQCG